jgi:hypothetical protein
MSDYPKPLEMDPLAIKREQEEKRLGDEIAELSAQIEAATYRLLVLIREYDKEGYWNNGAARSCAHWLAWRCSLDSSTARERIRVARALEHLPLISEALRKAEISYSKARALTRAATPESEAKLLNIALHGNTSHVEKVVRAWRKLDAAAEREQANRQELQRSLKTYTDEDGMLVLKARLSPETGAVVLRALEAAQDALYEQDNPPPTELSQEQRRADALGLVAESALKHELDKGTRGDRYQVVVHVDEPVLADPDQPGQSVLEDGQNVSAETSRRLACDGSKVVMRHGEDGTVLDVGRKTRVIPPAIRRALEFRDKTCRFPGCGLKYCDSHHIEHWTNGGKTKLENLVLICRLHHTALHEGGYHVDFRPDGELQFYWPDGQPMREVPPPPTLDEDPIEAFRDRHGKERLEIDGRTVTPQWGGEPLDLDWVMHILRQGEPLPPTN